MAVWLAVLSALASMRDLGCLDRCRLAALPAVLVLVQARVLLVLRIILNPVLLAGVSTGVSLAAA